MLLGELTDLLSHDLDQDEADPKLTQYLTLDAGCLPHARCQDRERTDGRSARSTGPRARTKYPTPIRIAAAASLAKQAARLDGQLDDSATVKALGEAAASGEPEVRQMAVYALGFFGGDSAAEILRERVKQDEDRFVRFNAAVALGRRGDLAAAGTLREMLSTPDLSQVHRPTRATTEKQNKIEAIELEAMGAVSDVDLERVGRTCQGAQNEITDLSKSGLVSVRSQARNSCKVYKPSPELHVPIAASVVCDHRCAARRSSRFSGGWNRSNRRFDLRRAIGAIACGGAGCS